KLLKTERYSINMHGSAHEYIEREHVTWLKTLEGLRQENVFLKNRLAEIIKDSVSKELLEQAEYFHNIFLNKDTVITLLRRDIALLATKISNPAHSFILLEQEQGKLRSDILRMEKEFLVVKAAFNKFLHEDM